MASDAQLLNQLLLAVAVGVPFGLETVLWRRRPRLLARFAYVPLATVRIPMGPQLRAALTPLATYRESGRRRLALSAWPGARVFHVGAAHAAELHPSGSRIWLRQAGTARWFCFGGAIGATLHVHGDQLELRGRGYPWLAATSLCFFAFVTGLAALDREWAILATLVAIGASFQALAAARCRLAWRQDALALAEALTREVRRMDA